MEVQNTLSLYETRFRAFLIECAVARSSQILFSFSEIFGRG